MIAFDEFIIKEPRLADVKKYFQLVKNNRENIARFFPITMRGAKNLESTAKLIRQRTALSKKKKQFTYVIVEKSSGKFIGSISLREFNREIARAEIGFFIDKEYEGKGITTKAVAAIVKHGFKAEKLNKLVMRIGVDNYGSRKVAEKNGFELEGILRCDYKTYHNEIVDIAYYGLLAKSKFKLQPSLENELVKLKPILPEDFDALYQVASDPMIWEQHPNKNRYQKDVFANFFKGAIDSKGAFLIYDKHTGSLIGTTRYYDVNIKDKSVAIGYTFLSRSHWGKAYNKAAKALLLQHAFSFVDNVIFHIGVNNIRSQKAIEKLGAIKIGEQEMSYYGEDSKLNFVYQISKKDWIKKRKD